MKFYMHQRIFSENLIKIGLILSAQWRFSEERYQACSVTLNICVIHYPRACTYPTRYENFADMLLVMII